MHGIMKISQTLARQAVVSSTDFTTFTGTILDKCWANEGRRYNVTSSPIDWAHTLNDPCR